MKADGRHWELGAAKLGMDAANKCLCVPTCSWRSSRLFKPEALSNMNEVMCNSKAAT
jgi:hypothetical protein